jgi:hypothetical protein
MAALTSMEIGKELIQTVAEPEKQFGDLDCVSLFIVNLSDAIINPHV